MKIIVITKAGRNTAVKSYSSAHFCNIVEFQVFFWQQENEPEVRLTVYAAYGIGHVMPFMVPKESVTNCRQCERIFAKETQQHYCRACGNVRAMLFT